jgi:hypothetical protein
MENNCTYYLYIIIFIILINFSLLKIYFLNFNFEKNEAEKLQNNYNNAVNNYIDNSPKLISDLMDSTVELKNKLDFIKK